MSQNPYAPPVATVQDLEESITERPRSVTVGVRILWALIGIRFAFGIYSLSGTGVYLLKVPAMAYVVAFGLVAAYFGTAFASLRATGQGRIWGRIVITVLVAMNLFATLWLMRELLAEAGDSIGGGGLLWIVAMIVLVPCAIEIAGAALLFTRASSDWYAAKRAA